MSHYHPVLYGINSWRRRSKKSKEKEIQTASRHTSESKHLTTHCLRCLLSKTIIILIRTKRSNHEWLTDIKKILQVRVNFRSFFLLSNVLKFRRFWHAQYFLRKKFNSLSWKNLTSNIFQWIYEENCSFGTIFF